MTQTLEERVRAIEERNQRVEREKGWETSFVRRGTIACCTYVVAVAWLWVVLKNEAPFWNATVPVVGYLLSTLSLSFVRNFWKTHRHS